MDVASRVALLVASGIMVLAAPTVGAQTTSTPADVDADAVQDIVVTAQRVSQNLQKVPLAVSVVDGEQLASRKLNDLAQLTVAVPSFQTSGDNAFAIRGVGSLLFQANIDSSVGVAVDEVSLGVPLFMSNGILDDIARVEVLQGPQGLLFGRNASAGLLNVVSNRPRLDRVEGAASVHMDWRDKVPGNALGFVTRGTINLPLTPTLALRVNALYSDQGPIADRVVGQPAKSDDDQRRLAGRAKLLFEPTDRASLYVIGDYSKERGIGGIFDRTFRSAGPNGFIAPALATVDRIFPNPKNLRYGADADMFRSVDTYGVSANAAVNLGEKLTLTNISAWRSYDLSLAVDTDGTSVDLLNINRNVSHYDQYSNELRIALAPGGVIDGQAGLYGFYSVLDQDSVLQGSAGTGIANYIGRDVVFRQTLRSLAAFGQLQFHLSPKLQIIAGARITDDRIHIDTRQNRFAYVVTLGPRTPPASQTYSNTNLSWKFGAQLDPTEDITAYATYSRGYKGPSFNQAFAVAGQNLVIGPETVGDIELGVKTALFDRRLRLNVAAFREDFQDFQVSALNIATGINAIGNAGSVRSQGIEVTINARPLRGLTLNAGATFLDSRFRSFVGSQCYLGQPNCLANGTFDAKGIRTPASARFTGTGQLRYDFPESRRITPFVEANYTHRSSVNFSSNGSPLTLLGAFDSIGASIGLRTQHNLELSIFCKNCNNDVTPTVLGYDSVDAVLRRVPTIVQGWGYNSVRTIGFTAAYRF